jgi:hypothetical protein
MKRMLFQGLHGHGLQSAQNDLDVLCVSSHLVVQIYEPPIGVVAVVKIEKATRRELDITQLRCYPHSRRTIRALKSEQTRFREKIDATRVSKSNTGVEEHNKTRLQAHEEKGKLFETQRLHLVGRKSRVAEPGNGSLDDLDVLVGGSTADADTANKVVVLVDGKTATKDNKTTVGLLNT